MGGRAGSHRGGVSGQVHQGGWLSYIPRGLLRAGLSPVGGGGEGSKIHARSDFWVCIWRDGWNRDFPGGGVDKTPRSQCKGPRFDPLSEN